MRELIDRAGLPDPDEVSSEFEPDEVVLVWWEEKLAVVVELDEPGKGPHVNGATPVLHCSGAHQAPSPRRDGDTAGSGGAR
jgi:hypothetical protein